jgi:peptide/nickel transport system permease protein
MYVVVMLVVDLAYAFVDPRITSQYTKRKQTNKSSAPLLSETAREDSITAAAADASAYIVPSELPLSDEKISDIGAILVSQTESDIAKMLQSSRSDELSGSARDYVTRNDGSIADGYTAIVAHDVIARYKKRSQMGEILHRLVRNKSSLAGMLILGSLILVALFSLSMSFESVTEANLTYRFSPPTWSHPFGADSMGRNVFLRVIYGTRYSIIIGFGAVSISVIIGVTLGSIAGYYGGRPDNVIMRISDVLASIPGILMGMVIMVVLGMNLRNLIIAAGAAGIPHFIRMSRASILTVKGNEFVEAARAIGFSDLRIIASQVLPNGLSPILVQATISLGLSIMMAASLSFLGFGVPAPAPEWGALVSAGREFARSAPWLMAFPGVAIMIIVLGLNLLGDGLRDALDPKLKK